MSSEYTKPTVGAASCNYATLHSYNRSQGMKPSVPAGFVPGSIVPVFPSFGSVGYNSLNRGEPGMSCSGYMGISNAYGRGASNCSPKYLHKVCGN